MLSNRTLEAARSRRAHLELAPPLRDAPPDERAVLARDELELVLAHHGHDVRLLARARAAHDDRVAVRAELCEDLLRCTVAEQVQECLAVDDELDGLARGAHLRRALRQLHGSCT
jgi:hypothetical protein